MRRIAPEYCYAVKRLEDDVTSISQPFIQEFYRRNVWHVRGRPATYWSTAAGVRCPWRAFFPSFSGERYRVLIKDWRDRTERQFDGKEK